MHAGPTQQDSFNCGIFTGLAALVFAELATGEFVTNSATGLAGGPPTCAGAHPDFLQRPEAWHNNRDASAWRILLHAAMMRVWMQDHHSLAGDELREAYNNARQRLTRLLHNNAAVAAEQTL